MPPQFKKMWEGEVWQGKLPDGIRADIKKILQMFEGRRVIVEIKEWKKQRSTPQNRHYWGFVIPVVDEWLRSYGEVWSKEAIHGYLVGHVGHYTSAYQLPTGEVYETRKSSTELTTEEWSEYLTLLEAWAAERGFVIPMPME